MRHPVTDAEEPAMDLDDDDEHLYACRSTEEIEALTVLCPSMASVITRKHARVVSPDVLFTSRSIPSWATCSDYFGSSSSARPTRAWQRLTGAGSGAALESPSSFPYYYSMHGLRTPAYTLRHRACLYGAVANC